MNQPFHIHLHGPHRGPIETSFETAAAHLQRLEKLYFEPDGSFVWARLGGSEQVFGMLYDAMGVLQYVELRGVCSLATFRALCQAVADPGLSLVVVVLPQGQLQDLQAFEGSYWAKGQQQDGCSAGEG